MKNIILFFILLLPFNVWAATYYPINLTFESGTAGDSYANCDPFSEACLMENNANSKRTNCDIIYADSTTALLGGIEGDEYITAREGSNLLAYQCEWIECAQQKQSWRQDTSLAIRSGTSSWNQHDQIDNNTEYWIGWSYFVPSNYLQERMGHQLCQITDPADAGHPNRIIFGIAMGGGISADCDPKYANWYGRHDWESAKTHRNWRTAWTNDKGNWVDIVLNIVWYSSNNANAKFEFFMDGVSVYDRGANKNVGFSTSRPVISINMYWPAVTQGNPCGPGDDCGSDSYVENYDQNFWRGTYLDAFRGREGAIGTHDYCDVAPAIWSSAPTINTPAASSTQDTAFTASYTGYSDHRTDSQGCFARTSTTVQIDENPADWSGMAYENTSAHQTTQDITGLSENTTYDMRVMHKSIRLGESDTYDGVWSSTVTFNTTQGPDLSSLSPSSQQACTTSPTETVTMSLTSDVNCDCRYSTNSAHTTYAAMSDDFSTTGAKSHSTNVTQSCGGATTYYIICNDGSDDSVREQIVVDVEALGGDTIPPPSFRYKSGGISANVQSSGGIAIKME